MARQLSRTSTRSDYPLFWRFACARTPAEFFPSTVALAGRLLKRGQAPEVIAHDMEYLSRRSGLSSFVSPIVNELAMRSEA